MTNTHFTKKSDRELFVYALLNLLTPFLSESYVLGYFECTGALVKCLAEYHNKYYQAVIDLMWAYLELDSEFCLEGEGSYEYKFLNAGIVEVMESYSGPEEYRHCVEQMIERFSD